MFRRVEATLEPDPSFPADLKQLGFFINNMGHIRMIEAPDKPYVFHSTNNERVNEVRREAMQTCQREEVEKRLADLGLNHVHLPAFTLAKPHGPHLPILAPPPEVLKSRKRVIVLVNDAMQDLGILAYRQLQRELGVNGGSVVDFVKHVITRSATESTADKEADIFSDGFKLDTDSATPALLVLNTGQQLYSHKFHQAMTLRSWSAMPRKSVAHDMIRIHDDENRIDGHRTPQEHVKTVFDDIVCNPDRIAPDAEVYVIAIEDGTTNVLNLLVDDFEKYGSRITAMALVHSLIDDSQIKDAEIRAFLHQRTRQWKYTDVTFDPSRCTELPADYEQGLNNISSSTTPSIMNSSKHISWHEDLPSAGSLSAKAKTLQPLASSVTATNKEVTTPTKALDDWASGQAVLCPTFGGGSNSVGECVFTDARVQNAILAFFEEVAQDPEHYRNPAFKPYTEAPQPTPDNPLALSASDFPMPDMLHPEQEQLTSARERLAEMHTALRACPVNVPELALGREKLALKVHNLQDEIEHLEKRALAHKALGAGQMHQVRGENWNPQIEGPKVPFAGTLVDSELLKAAGLMGGADMEEKEPEEEEGGEKAFL